MNALEEFISNIDHETRKNDTIVLQAMLTKVSGYQPYLDGTIIGFGQYHYQNESGHQGNAPVIGFSPRKQHLVVYIMPGFNAFEPLLAKLGKCKVGMSCLYINKLSNINLEVLESLAKLSIKYMQSHYVCQSNIVKSD
ncbi:DUF1801 domain-containing protein [Colwellia sp. D2M02]|uniref:DUF1801 domain-containing protein n=1 Tax=Colwellia sp. D2M02 TaxID=2841562 RepID=UPI001C0A1943|nr:DUF1801 domain-containing protein [Colwellia sp. D2M02]MBU2893366.1 DUF1801 domain-containing protein [Colwellia sp. D2M02]